MVASVNPMCVYIRSEKVCQLQYLDKSEPLTAVRINTSLHRQAEIRLLLEQLGCWYEYEPGPDGTTDIIIKVKLEANLGRLRVLSDLASVIRNFSVNYDASLKKQLAWF